MEKENTVTLSIDDRIATNMAEHAFLAQRQHKEMNGLSSSWKTENLSISANANFTSKLHIQCLLRNSETIHLITSTNKFQSLEINEKGLIRGKKHYVIVQ